MEPYFQRDALCFVTMTEYNYFMFSVEKRNTIILHIYETFVMFSSLYLLRRTCNIYQLKAVYMAMFNCPHRYFLCYVRVRKWVRGSALFLLTVFNFMHLPPGEINEEKKCNLFPAERQ
jgi:hypothetical protein